MAEKNKDGDDLPELEELSHPAESGENGNHPDYPPNLVRRVIMRVHKFVRDILDARGQKIVYDDDLLPRKFREKERSRENVSVDDSLDH